MNKTAKTSAPINGLAQSRWSPRAFLDKPVEPEKLRSLFEAARWSASGGNEQPWRFIVGVNRDETWQKIFESLDEGNKIWNEKVPVLILAIGYTISSWDGNISGYYHYDTGQAVAHLSVEAMNQGLHVHQMGGFSAEKARELFSIPENCQPLTAIAAGYIGDPETLPEKLRQRELQERTRKELPEIVFSGKFGNPWTILLILISLIIASCNQPGKQETSDKEEVATRPKVEVPPFNADSAYVYIGKQLAFGPRVPNTPAHAKCADYLTGELRKYTSTVIEQKGVVYAYDRTKLNFRNIIASWKPETNNRILLCAHWDSRPFADHDPDPANRRKPVEGANDGASGVGVLLEIARQLSLKEPPIGIDIILFDVEDYGPHQEANAEPSNDHWGLGSQYWAKNPHKPGYFAKYGILLDMVGASGAKFLMEGISMDYAGDIVKHVWETAGRLGYSSVFVAERGGYITDDHLPINQILNIPTIDIIHQDRNTESGFYPYWHTTGDTFDKIDRNTLKIVGQTVLTVIFEEQ
jgi:nitroreductase